MYIPPRSGPASAGIQDRLRIGELNGKRKLFDGVVDGVIFKVFVLRAE